MIYYPTSQEPDKKPKPMEDESYYCPCGHIIHDDWDYCPGCGKPTGNNMEWNNEDDYYDEP